MAADKLVDSVQLESDLTSIANTIRSKGGTSAQLSFPSGFIQAIEDISGGSSSGYSLNDIAEHNYQGTAVTITAERAFSSSFRRTPFVSVSMPNCIRFTDAATVTQMSYGTYVFAECPNLESISLPELLACGERSFLKCTSLTDVYLPKGAVGQYAFSGCTALRHIALPHKGQSQVTLNQAIFSGCTSLEAVDLDRVYSISSYEFQNCQNLQSLILRRTQYISELNNINAFTGTPFASGGTGGTLYVPSDLIQTYESATNWSTILAYENNSIQAIEGSQFENTYADGRAIT